MLPPTKRLYWDDDHCFHAEARILAIDEDRIACDRTCFYAGGGGQPADAGTIVIAGSDPIEVVAVQVDDNGVIWHQVSSEPDISQVGELVSMKLETARRIALARYHTVLHVVNTIALRDYDAWMTGAQIGVDYSRIDFKIERFSPELVQELQHKVNEVLQQDLKLQAFFLSESEFAARPDLLRTLEVKPPVVNGHVRVVAIVGFDEQACGGTHVHATGELGRFEIFKTENKGKINKRLYVRLVF
jgi:misacylated tRNA(Ala) deacylase